MNINFKKAICLPSMLGFFFSFFLLTAVVGSAQEKDISGQVMNEEGNGLAGVTVLVIDKSGDQNGTLTDDNGSFTVRAITSDSLLFSSVGFVSKKIKVGESSNLKITLLSESKGLEELVVVGYGNQERRQITSAISTINTKRLENFSNTNPTQLLAGQATGVQVKETSGAPGSEFEVTIRGLGSIGASSAPLYVVDGFPVGNTLGQNFNPTDIESISILKDAVSTAIYGARGANGVVLITTKQAEKDEIHLSLSARFGITNVPVSRRTKVMNGEEFAQFRKERAMDMIRFEEGREPDLSEIPEDFRYPENTEFSTNWLNEILHDNAPFQKYDISFSNGGEKIQSMINASYTNQEGALIKTGYKGYSVRSNVGGEFNDFINFGLILNGSYSNQDLSDASGVNGIIGNALLMDPREPVYNEDGSYNNYIGDHDGIFGYGNPVQILNEVTNERRVGDFMANAFLEFKFLRNFSFKPSANIRFSYVNSKKFTPSTISGQNTPAPRDASENDSNDFLKNISTDQLITYKNSFDEHNIDILLGFSAQEESVRNLNGSGREYPDDLTQFLGSAEHQDVVSSKVGWSMLAYFARVNYSFKGKYLLSASYRREGSSRFGESNRYGNFPGFSLGWIISDEDFLSSTDWLSLLKVRGSWGKTGNNNIGNYSSLAFLNRSNYVFGDKFTNGNIIGSLNNNHLGWEKAEQVDIGLDFAVFDNSLTFSFDFYRKITTDMLFAAPVPAITGFTEFLDNIGKVRNLGAEFAIGYNKSLGEVNLWANLNISVNRNKVLALRSNDDEIVSGSLYDDYNVTRVGRPIGMIYGFKTLGIFQNQKEIDDSPTQDGAIPGSFKFWDASGDGEIQYDRTDMVEIGDPWPDFTWGLTIGVSYQNFDVSALLTGSQGYDVFSRIQSSTMNMDGVFNVLVDAKDRWRSEENPGKRYWPTTNFWKWERESNSRYVYDASHMWVKDITIGYTFPKRKNLPFGFRTFASVHNLALITNYPGNNPDINNKGGINPGFDDLNYPIPRTFTLGVDLNF